MAHNPNKSRVLCVFAKASYWSLPTLGWIMLTVLVVGASSALVWAAYKNWSWAGIGHNIKGAAILIGVLTAFTLPIWGLTALHAWAKRYRADC